MDQVRFERIKARMLDPDLRLAVDFSREFDIDEMIGVAREAARLFFEASRDGQVSDISDFLQGGAFPGDQIKFQTTTEMHLVINVSGKRKSILIYPHNFRLADHTDPDNNERIDAAMRECVRQIREQLQQYDGLDYAPPPKRWP